MSRRVKGQLVRAGLRALSFAMLFALAVAQARAQHPIPESERWATITHPGNEPYPNLSPDGYPDLMGRVDYEYQISRTELTVAEWFEFVQAYAPYLPASQIDGNLTGDHIRIIRLPNNQFQFQIIPTAENNPAASTWRFAARYCNWLHNDKRPEQAAFESGVYDTSTFGQYNDNGAIVYTDQIHRSPGARYFMPTMDEWVKAGYFDPNRYGLGMPGYWQQPNGTDVPLIPGAPPPSPTDPGQTSTGWPPADDDRPEVASYRNVQSPWGLWDLSGGWQEWVEDVGIDPAFGPVVRLQRGSWIDGADRREWDRIDRVLGTGPHLPGGIRLARVVPSPHAVPGLILLSILSRRRFRCVGTHTSRSRPSSSPP